MKVLVTGANGFLGSAVVRELIAAGRYEVIPLLRRSRGQPNEIVADLTDSDISSRLPSRVDLIIHAGAYVPERESAAELDVAMANNAGATLRLLEYAVRAGAPRLIYASSAAVYGVPLTPGAVAENVEPRPDNAYALSKLAGELMLEPYRFVHGVPTVGLRFSYIYGAGMRESSVVKKFAAMAKNHAPIPLFNGGRDYFDLIHISDVVRAVMAATQEVGGIYNIGSGQPTSVLELATALIEVTGSRSVIEKLPPKENYHSKFLDIARAASTLSWRPKMILREGLREI